jgi:hypothetical protein
MSEALRSKSDAKTTGFATGDTYFHARSDLDKDPKASFFTPTELADRVVLDSNPLEDLHNSIDLKYVMKNGELSEAETMDQIWDTPSLLTQTEIDWG